MTEWRKIPSHPNYDVSDDGRVRSWVPLGGRPGFRMRPVAEPRVLKTNYTAGGYAYVNLGRRFAHQSIHRLMLEAFHGACPDGWMARFKDGDRSNLTLSNLEWTNRKVWDRGV